MKRNDCKTIPPDRTRPIASAVAASTRLARPYRVIGIRLGHPERPGRKTLRKVLHIEHKENAIVKKSPISPTSSSDLQNPMGFQVGRSCGLGARSWAAATNCHRRCFPSSIRGFDSLRSSNDGSSARGLTFTSNAEKPELDGALSNEVEILLFI